MTAETISFISCPKGIEGLLKDELSVISDLTIDKQHTGGLQCSGTVVDLYKICLWSRLANRVLLLLYQFPSQNKKQLYDGLLNFNWGSHMQAEQSLHIRFFGELTDIQHTQYGAQLVKDAAVDYFRQHSGKRPSVVKDQPDLRFQVNIEQDQVRLYLDLSGDSLHQRGYRQGITEAPLKENLAAALLVRAGWPQIAAAGGALCDTFCGSGTFLNEAALIAANVAPGVLRKYFGFNAWLQHDVAEWQALRNSALTEIKTDSVPIIGYDKDSRVIGVAKQAAENIAQYTAPPRVYKRDIQQWVKPTHINIEKGLLISNPPYGQRMQDNKDLYALYQKIGESWVQECPNWAAALFTNDADLIKATRFYWDKEYKFLNGTIECKLYLLNLQAGLKDKILKKATLDANRFAEIGPFLKRLQKNQRRLAGWLKQNNIECYRLYFADIPEYPFIVDIYKDWSVVQEYQTERANNHLDIVLAALPDILGIPSEHIVLKKRQQQKGTQQYTKLTSETQRIQVQETQANIWLDLHSYLDTGLFLDHRPLRIKLASECHGKRFLNLFCYTAVATVHAALGGAVSSISVDMSNTYLDWARQNFKLNNINLSEHTLIKADVLAWLKICKKKFDVIFLDPPTFSNSKRMQKTLDIQRDHVDLIVAAMECLAADGVMYFSTNYRRFRIDDSILHRYAVKDITDWSIPRDFNRPNKVHYCYKLEPLDNTIKIKSLTTETRSVQSARRKSEN